MTRLYRLCSCSCSCGCGCLDDGVGALKGGLEIGLDDFRTRRLGSAIWKTNGIIAFVQCTALPPGSRGPFWKGILGIGRAIPRQL